MTQELLTPKTEQIMKQAIIQWWNTENKAYSELIGERTTNGMIATTAACIFGGILYIGLAKIVEEAL